MAKSESEQEGEDHGISADPTDVWSWVDAELAELRERHLLRVPSVRDSAQTPSRVRFNGEDYINFSSNDYLGLAADPRLASAAADALTSAGWGAGASPMISGRSATHAELESELARFEQAEAALLFPTGYAANLGVLSALAGPQDSIVSDAKNHASIIDGCRLSKATVHIYPHRDVNAARERLQFAAKNSRRVLLVTDSLFSMDGCLAPLDALFDIVREQGAMLVVDEAHATGVLGKNGRGGCELFGLLDGLLDGLSDVASNNSPLVRVGTLSKAVGSVGGFVVGPSSVIEFLRNRARTQFFSTAMPAAVAAASLRALRILHDEPERRQRLETRCRVLRHQLREMGWNVPMETPQERGSPIVPVVIGSPEATMQLSERLRQQGLLVPGIRPPSVPVGEALLRISVSYAHRAEDMEALVDAMQCALD